MCSHTLRLSPPLHNMLTISVSPPHTRSCHISNSVMPSPQHRHRVKKRRTNKSADYVTLTMIYQTRMMYYLRAETALGRGEREGRPGPPRLDITMYEFLVHDTLSAQEANMNIKVQKWNTNKKEDRVSFADSRSVREQCILPHRTHLVRELT
jgi:hypothetical protein